MRPRRIGLDLDNTVIDYGPAIPVVAQLLGFDDSLRSRGSIRAAYRMPEDDWEWQRFQSVLYTDGLKYATPAPGLEPFLQRCSEYSVELTIVSHKTAHTPSRFGSRSLREPATSWLRTMGITPDHVGPESVFYCSTRDEKLQTIAALGLEVFVDDLPEVLSDPQMPTSVVRFLYREPMASPASNADAGSDIRGVTFADLSAWLDEC